jgi:hypothetical protein
MKQKRGIWETDSWKVIEPPGPRSTMGELQEEMATFYVVPREFESWRDAVTQYQAAGGFMISAHAAYAKRMTPSGLTGEAEALKIAHTIAMIPQMIDTLEWVREKIHQAYEHPDPEFSCPKNTCDAINRVLNRVAAPVFTKVLR